MHRRTFLHVSTSVVAGLPSLTFGDESSYIAGDGYTASLAIIKSFARYINVIDTEVDADEECLAALEPFGGSGRRALFYSLFSDDFDTSLLAIICIREHYPTFEEGLPSFPALLRHPNPRINQYAPALLCLYGEKARFAIPQLEACLSDNRPWFRALVADSIAKIAPELRQQMISIVETATDDPLSRCVLADLRGEDPYSGS
jgi:hypothetical protein